MPEYRTPDQIEPTSLDHYLEVMSRAVFQTGMAWKVIATKWDDIRTAFQGFDARKNRRPDRGGHRSTRRRPRVIRNGRKIAAIVGNAARMIELERRHGTFRAYLRSHGGFDATLAALKKDFKFMGRTGGYYFLYVVGEDVPPHSEFVATRPTK